MHEGDDVSGMRRLLILAVAWTGVVVAVLLLWPWSLPATGCWRLVDPPAGCLAELAQMNGRIWWTQTLPMLAFFASGYAIVGLFAIRRSSPARPPGAQSIDRLEAAPARRKSAPGIVGRQTDPLDPATLATRRCVPADHSTERLPAEEVERLRAGLDAAWRVEGDRLVRDFAFPTFAAAFGLATRVALLAEDQNHHPAMEVAWGRLSIAWTTDAIGGLSTNDLIMAAKVDRLVGRGLAIRD